MGNIKSLEYVYSEKPELLPESDCKPSFKTDYGFDKPRRRRVMIATEDEMRAAQVPLDRRDYCAHLYINYKSCERNYYPFAVMCKPEKHLYLDCQYEDYILRMKEFEREKRLKAREARIAAN